jgi:hypothetical protein
MSRHTDTPNGSHAAPAHSFNPCPRAALSGHSTPVRGEISAVETASELAHECDTSAFDRALFCIHLVTAVVMAHDTVISAHGGYRPLFCAEGVKPEALVHTFVAWADGNPSKADKFGYVLGIYAAMAQTYPCKSR